MLKLILRALLGIPGWLLYTIPMIFLIIVGIFIVFWEGMFGSLVSTPSGDDPLWRVAHFATNFRKRGWSWLWDNDEDGVDGEPIKLGSREEKNPEWTTQTDSWGLFRRIFQWSAVRNSVGNARRTAFFGMTVDHLKAMIAWPEGAHNLDAGPDLKEGPYVAWQGWRYELKFCWNPKQPDWIKRRYFWLGWRIAQVIGIEKNVGFAFQPWAKL